MIQTIAEHKIDLDLLIHPGNILDLGCRGFIFTNEMRRLGHIVYPVDVDLLEGYTPSKDYIRVAITGKSEQRVGIKRTSDPQATSIIEGDEIWTHTIESFTSLAGVGFWDYIKTDIEGSEYDVIMSLTKAPSYQFEVEFHLHTDAYHENQVDSMVRKLKSLGYETVSHEKTDQHGCGLNYWSSLFILK